MMAMAMKTSRKAEFGDFQTPAGLAADICRHLKASGIAPASIAEPTCGIGNFLVAAIEEFPNLQRLIGIDVNRQYIASAAARLGATGNSRRVDLRCASFFATDWDALLASLPAPVLILGNPPWVTNAQLGALDSDNLPAKANFHGRAGLDALTGKSNFDISEWMITRLLEAMGGRPASLAMLCKTAVARRAMLHAWESGIAIDDACLYRIDATEHFGAAVDACLLVCRTGGKQPARDCRVYASLAGTTPSHIFGYRDDQLVAEAAAFDAWRHLQGAGPYRWRSGIKHDCAPVMELRRAGRNYQNGFGDSVAIEPDYLFPMLKSSDIARGNVSGTTRYMLTPQKHTGQETSLIEKAAPATWAYLLRHGALLDRRGSRIYRNRPRFSIFGVGPYSFALWKVAISGFYKSLKFRVIGPFEGKPVVLDDTCNFIPCRSEVEALCMAALLNSPVAAAFFSSFIFWDAKRPITIELLRRIDLAKVAPVLGLLPEAQAFFDNHATN